MPLNYEGGLGSWICKQRYRAREGMLAENQVQLLKDVGVDFEYKKRRASKTNRKGSRKNPKLSVAVTG